MSQSACPGVLQVGVESALALVLRVPRAASECGTPLAGACGLGRRAVPGASSDSGEFCV